jgi:hypothetical protein
MNSGHSFYAAPRVAALEHQALKRSASAAGENPPAGVALAIVPNAIADRGGRSDAD